MYTLKNIDESNELWDLEPYTLSNFNGEDNKF